jgi:transposase
VLGGPSRTEEIAEEVRNLNLTLVVKDLRDNGDSWTSKIIERYVENFSAEMTLRELCKFLHEWGNDYARPASNLARIHLSAIMRIRERSGVGTVASVFEAISETRELFKFVRR